LKASDPPPEGGKGGEAAGRGGANDGLAEGKGGRGGHTNGVGGHHPHDGGGSADDGADEGVAQASEQTGGPVQQRTSRTLRLLYWALWFGVLPIVLGCIAVWALSPSSASELVGAVGWVQSMVRAQPVPVGIVLFTAFEIALWSVRHELPFARHAHPPLRPDVPERLRGKLEQARALLDEAELLLGRHAKVIVREVSAREREHLRGELDDLRATMARVPFDIEAFGAALGRADAEVDAHLGPWRKSEVREYVEAIVMAVAVAFALRAFVIEAFKIPSGSMIPTLMVGDHIFVNKFSYGPAIPFTQSRLWSSMPPRRGDVMVFAFPEHPEQDFIKRVIAVEGDKLEARAGHPIINGWEVPSCRVGSWAYSDYDSPITRHEGDLFVEYLGNEVYLTFYDRSSGMFPEMQGPFSAQKGEVWVMGDNRNNSHDSRMWYGGRGGGVPFANIRGRALFVWLSVSDSGVDWSRMGAPVMGLPRLPPAAMALQPELDACLKARPAVTNPPPSTP
jgi:signal peptidase I